MMNKTLTFLFLLTAAAFSASATSHVVTWKKSADGPQDVYTCRGIHGDFTAKLEHKGQAILRPDKPFSISITTTSDTNTPHKGFANEFGTGLLSTADPYADPLSNAGDNQFCLYVGCGKDVSDWRTHDMRKVELHLNHANNAVSNYKLNHKNDGFKNRLTLSFTLDYTPAKEGYKAKMTLTPNKGSDVTFDPLVIKDVTTSAVFRTLQNGGTVSAPPRTHTDLKITVESDRFQFTTSHYILAALACAALFVLILAASSGKKHH